MDKYYGIDKVSDKNTLCENQTIILWHRINEFETRLPSWANKELVKQTKKYCGDNPWRYRRMNEKEKFDYSVPLTQQIFQHLNILSVSPKTNWFRIIIFISLAKKMSFKFQIAGICMSSTHSILL